MLEPKVLRRRDDDDADEKACYDFYKKSKGSIHSIKTTFPSMRIVVLMHIVVLIIVVPFQTKTDVTTSSYEGFSLYVIKDAHRSVDHCSTASNDLPPNRFLEFDKILKV